VHSQEQPWPGSLTWSVGSGFLWVQFGPQGSPGLQLGLGELGQVGHDRMLIHIGIHNLLGSDHLSQAKGRGHWASPHCGSGPTQPWAGPDGRHT
jgi:hypothetical protein